MAKLATLPPAQKLYVLLIFNFCLISIRILAIAEVTAVGFTKKGKKSKPQIIKFILSLFYQKIKTPF